MAIARVCKMIFVARIYILLFVDQIDQSERQYYRTSSGVMNVDIGSVMMIMKASMLMAFNSIKRAIL